LTQVCDFSDKTILPSDIEFKGYEEVIVQDIKVITNNTLFRKKVYYSKSLKKSFTAPLPQGYKGSFGPNIKAMIVGLKYIGNMSEPKILELLKHNKILISSGTISNIIVDESKKFDDEKRSIIRSGIESSVYTQIDDTGSRVKGKNHHTHIMTNENFVSFDTKEKKNRQVIIEVLMNGEELKYLLNESSFEIAKKLKVGKKAIATLEKLKSEKFYTKKQFEKLLFDNFANIPAYLLHKIMDTAAISYYRNQNKTPIISTLVCDDAHQFKDINNNLALCWVHEARMYKKLTPLVPQFMKIKSQYINDFWLFYETLFKYKKNPTDYCINNISQQFDDLFSIETGYKELDKIKKRTMRKKALLLTVLKVPKVPLHNNRAELGARAQVRKRDISLHTMSAVGTKAMNIFMTVVETAKILKVNPLEYLYDRISGKKIMPSLATIINN